MACFLVTRIGEAFSPPAKSRSRSYAGQSFCLEKNLDDVKSRHRWPTLRLPRLAIVSCPGRANSVGKNYRNLFPSRESRLGDVWESPLMSRG